MLDTIKRYLKVFFSVRLLPVLVVYILLFALLVNRSLCGLDDLAGAE